MTHPVKAARAGADSLACSRTSLSHAGPADPKAVEPPRAIGKPILAPHPRLCFLIGTDRAQPVRQGAIDPPRPYQCAAGAPAFGIAKRQPETNPQMLRQHLGGQGPDRKST